VAVSCGVVGVDAIENCCFKISAYVLLVSECSGLSSRCGSEEEGGLIPCGIDFLINGSKFASSHSRASVRLAFVVTTKHLFLVTDSIRRNQDFCTRWS